MKLLPDSVFEQHIAITGKVGSGKTYAARGFTERLLTNGRRVCVIDPTGAWHGLRSSADGKRAGFPVVVFGGDHGDVPITAESAAPLARMIAEQNLPCVIDVSGLLIGEQRQFMAEFAEKIFQLNRKPLHLVIDEADIFAPQNPQKGDEKMLHRVDRIVRRGRIRGFRVTLITQRPAVLHKNVLTQANVLISMRMTAPQDRKALEEWIKGQGDTEKGKILLASLASLPTGEGWAWAPELDILERMKFPRITTFDSGRTPDDDGEMPEPVRLADVDLTEINAALADAIKEAAENDPKALRAEIAKLKQQVAGTPAVKQALPVGFSRADIEASYQRGVVEGGRSMARALDVQTALLDRGIERLGEPIQAIKHAITMAKTEPSILAPKINTPRPLPPVPVRNARPAVSQSTDTRHVTIVATEGDPVKLSKAERVVLIALAQYPMGRTKSQVAILTGYASTGGGFNNALSSNRSAGRLEGAGDNLRITPRGLADLGPFEPLPHGRELLDHWRRQLSKAERAALDALVDAYPDPLTKEQLAERAGYEASGGGFNNALSRLRTLELIEGRVEVRASDHLFG